MQPGRWGLGADNRGGFTDRPRTKPESVKIVVDVKSGNTGAVIVTNVVVGPGAGYRFDRDRASIPDQAINLSNTSRLNRLHHPRQECCCIRITGNLGAT